MFDVGLRWSTLSGVVASDAPSLTKLRNGSRLLVPQFTFILRLQTAVKLMKSRSLLLFVIPLLSLSSQSHIAVCFEIPSDGSHMIIAA